MNMEKSILIIVIVSVVTLLLRLFPFIIFNNKREIPKIITYLSNYLPFAIIGMLVVYCYKSVDLITKPYGIPELIAGVIVVLLHLWRKNTLLSIICGTIVYMVLVQFIFI